jgi:hypothetical protein
MNTVDHISSNPGEPEAGPGTEASKITELPTARRKGRPLGSKNKPKKGGNGGEHPTVIAAVKKAARGNGSAQPNGPITADNVFDNLNAIRKSDPTKLIAEKLVEVHLAVRKPKPKEYFRVCDDPEMSISLMVYVHRPEDSFDEEHYMVLPSMERYFEEQEEGRQVQIVLCVNDRGVYFLWPLPVPDPDGKDRTNVTTARAAARMALTEWLRIKWRKADASYVPHVKEDQSQVPVWPDKKKEPLNVLLKRGFGKKIIDSTDHPIVRKDLRGLDAPAADKEGKEDTKKDWL